MKASLLFFLASIAIASVAMADGDAGCQAQSLNGKWNCQGKTITFKVSENQGVYQLDPTESLEIPVILDGQSHDFSSSFIMGETTGTCQGNVISVEGSIQGLSFNQQFTVVSAKKMSIAFSANEQNATANCSKE